jgi:hypothetical protein
MAAMIPHLVTLDSILVDQNSKNTISNGMILEAASAMQLEQEELDDEKRMEMAILGDEFNTAMGYLGNGDPVLSELPERIPQNRIPGSFPDTGSDLTHGSSVVLAGDSLTPNHLISVGSMATAMRRRRQSTPTEDKKSDSSDSSALDALDSALINGGITMKGRGDHFYGEGDITSLVLSAESGGRGRSPRPSAGTSSPHLKGKQKKPPNPNVLSISFDGETGSLDRYDDMCEPSPLIEARLEEQWLARPSSTRHPSRGMSPSRRTPSPGSARSRNGLPPSSPPIQRNASRPSSSRAVGIAAITPSAPFKVLVPVSLRNESEDFANRMNINRHKASQVGSNKSAPLQSTHPRLQKTDIWDLSEDSSDDEAVPTHSRSLGTKSDRLYQDEGHRNKTSLDRQRTSNGDDRSRPSVAALSSGSQEVPSPTSPPRGFSQSSRANTLSNVVRAILSSFVTVAFVGWSITRI